MRFAAVVVAVISVAWSASGAAASCDNVDLPDEGSKTSWYCDTDADTVIVFVHGFNSNNRTAWLRSDTKTKRGHSFWPQLVLEDDALELPERSGKKPAIFLAGYYAAADGTTFGFADARKQLYDALRERLGDSRSVLDRRNILFVAHSAGGIVVRDMLLTFAEAFAGKRLGLLLVASPSKGSNYASSLAPAQALAESVLVNQLGENSAYLVDLDQRFRAAISLGGKLEGLRGKEIYEHRILVGERDPNAGWFNQIVRAVLETMAASAMQQCVVNRASAAVYFPNPALIPDSNHSSIARPQDVNGAAHLALREVYRQVLAARAQPCDPPAHFSMIFDIAGQPNPQTGGKKAEYQLIQLDPTGEAIRTVYTERDAFSGFQRARVTDAPFACPGDKFWAKLTRIAAHSIKTSSAETLTQACFRRSRTNSQANRAFLRCVEGGSCKIDEEVPGLAEDCPLDQVAALPTIPEAAASAYWQVPSLATLTRQSEEVRSGYTEFTIDSGPLSNVSGVTHLSYAVSVNGVSIHMDGLTPHLERIPFDEKGGVHLTFALENLGFNGGNDGFETVDLELRLYNGKRALRTVKLERQYVSYRHAAPITLSDHGDAFEWRGFYRPAKVQASYEVMIEHGGADWIRKRRAMLDARGAQYDGQPVIGVIRPGRTENPRTGMIVGLRQVSGQVKSLFSRDEADAICRWVVAGNDFDGLQRKGAYIFQFPPEAFTELRDRGRKIALCQDAER
jgi:pimeloyl-ACP methyl ester carboxylesterase